jgi:hypothetical protein
MLKSTICKTLPLRHLYASMMWCLDEGLNVYTFTVALKTADFDSIFVFERS